MTAENKQIVISYEQLGMSIEDIALDTGMDENIIKSILMQCSSLFRKDSKKEPELEFDDAIAKEAMDTLVNIMRYTEDDPSLQAKVAKFIYEDKKGRLDNGRALAQLPGSIAVTFNLQMQKALEARERTLKNITVITNGEAKPQEELELVNK